jgi:hypothetical protein
VKRILYYSFLSALFIIPTLTKAQPTFNLHFTTAFPVNEFSDYMNKTGFGGNAEIFFSSPTPKKPYGFGLDFSCQAFGIHFLNDEYTDDLYMSLNRAQNFASMHLIFQVAPPAGRVKPYFEALFGGSYIFSNTEVLDYYYHTQSLFFDDWAWSYGIGGGLKFLVSDEPFYDRGAVYFDLKVRYMFSTPTEYVDRNSVRYANDTFYFDTIESRTDMVLLQIGFQVYF